MRERDPRSIPVPALWDQLSRAGRRCLVIDVPLCKATMTPGVRHVVDWGTHDRQLQPAGFPAAVDDWVRDNPHPMPQRCDDYGAAGRHDDLVEVLRAGLRTKARAATELAHAEPWDLAMVVFGETHCAGHHLWHLHEHDPERSPLVEVYRAADDALGTFVREVVEPGDTLAVLLSHGIGSHHDGDWLLHDLLARLDDALGPPSALRRHTERARRIGGRYGRTMAARLGRPIAYTRPIDASRRWFKVPNNELYGAVRLNLAGRDPRGLVQPGRAAEDAETALREALLALRNDETGEPVVRRVWPVRDDFGSGPMVAWLPDLLVAWNRRAPIRVVSHPTLGRFVAGDPAVRTGDHREGGLLVVDGPGVAPGLGPTILAEDLAPSLAAMLGVTLAGVAGTPTDLRAPTARP
jgi:predicted AlkP superfamily phosphohydrolase/phosphomutase